MTALAWAIHGLTCLGGVCALLAALAFFDHAPQAAFAWLGLALVIDGIDGPLARAANVKAHVPKIDGDVLDLVVDYLTYVFVPVIGLVAGGFLAGRGGWMIASAILMSSLLYFADRGMKDEFNRFVGFPAIWNVVAFYIYAFTLSGPATWAVAVVLVVATFLPLRWVHPLRVVQYRLPTLLVMLGGSVAACWTVWRGFPAGAAAAVTLLAALGYWVALTGWWWWRERSG